MRIMRETPDLALPISSLPIGRMANRTKRRRTAQRLLAARRNFTIARMAENPVIRRDTARLEADIAALRAAGLPMG